MAKSYNDNFKLTLDINAQNSVDIGTAKYATKYTYESVFTNGSGNGQAELIYTDERTLAGSANEDLNLDALTDQFGDTIVGVTLKALIVEASSANGDSIVVGGASSNTMLNIFSHASDKILVKPGGLFAWRAPNTGAAITASTGDLLRIENADSSDATYKILMVFTD